MDKQISTKIQKKIDNISKLKLELGKWEDLPENEVFKLIKEFEKTPRDEGSSFYNDYFNDSRFAELLIEIAGHYSSDSKTNLYIISALGNMMRRYELPETDSIYQLMIDNSQRKGIAPYVAIYLPRMEKFKNFPNKWEYYLSIKTMSPKKLAETKFIDIIEDKLHDVPSELKEEIIGFLNNKIESSSSDYNKTKFSEMIKAIA